MSTNPAVMIDGISVDSIAEYKAHVFAETGVHPSYKTCKRALERGRKRDRESEPASSSDRTHG